VTVNKQSIKQPFINTSKVSPGYTEWTELKASKTIDCRLTLPTVKRLLLKWKNIIGQSFPLKNCRLAEQRQFRFSSLQILPKDGTG
jgi:hypothetical protein